MHPLIVPILRPLAVVLACLALLGGCGDKHAPVKPTVTGSAIQ